MYLKNNILSISTSEEILRENIIDFLKDKDIEKDYKEKANKIIEEIKKI